MRLVNMARTIAVIPFVSLLLTLGIAQQSPQAGSTDPSNASAGQSIAASADQPIDTGTVMRITVNLVQMDAVVMDSKGNPVTNLKPQDFVALQDGKPQTITHFSYISNETPASTADGEVQPSTTKPASSTAVKREDVRRTIAIVVDDLALSFESTVRVRVAVNKFIDEQVQAGDLVALVSTGKGAGAFQQFTTDKQVMHAAAERIRFNFTNRVGLFSMPAAVFSSKERTVSTPQASEDQRAIEHEQYMAGTLGALQWVIRGLREMPGRKSVVLFSEDLSMLNGNGIRSAITEMVQRVVDAANRSSVVFYVIDPRGLMVLGPSAADASSPSMNQTTQALWASQDGMGVLAYGTGGLLVVNNNDMRDALRQVMRDQKGYYLIGYKPDAGTFDLKKAGPQFHNIKVRLRPGLRGMKIRSRSGFYGVTDEEIRSRSRSREQMMATALFSPFAAKDIRVRLTPLFAEREKIGPFVQTLLHVDARDLKFNDDAGKYKAQVDVVMATFSADGVPVDLTQRTLSLELSENDYRTCLERGALFTLAHRVKKAGGYQFRAVIRDVNANKLGSVNQFIEVPDLKKRHLALSGIVLHEVHPNTPPVLSAGEMGIPTDGWSAREFRPGTELAYDYEIMNPRREQTSQKPKLQAQIRLMREGKQLFESKLANVGTLDGDDSKYFAVQGAFRLGNHMEPGSYVLQLFVTDDLAPQKYKTATQWIDFEVTE